MKKSTQLLSVRNLDPPARDVGVSRRGQRRYLEFNGLSLTLKEWAAHTGLSKETLKSRIYTHRWRLADAFTTPLSSRGHRRHRSDENPHIGLYAVPEVFRRWVSPGLFTKAASSAILVP